MSKTLRSIRSTGIARSHSMSKTAPFAKLNDSLTVRPSTLFAMNPFCWASCIAAGTKA
jgi:hypothetical protein